MTQGFGRDYPARVIGSYAALRTRILPSRPNTLPRQLPHGILEQVLVKMRVPVVHPVRGVAGEVAAQVLGYALVGHL